MRRELGVSPIELVQTRRLLLAKQLLTETLMSVTSVAYASGFGRLRRFNDAFMRRYGMAPTRLRKAAADPMSMNGEYATAETLTLQLAYRPPYDWPGILQFLRGLIRQLVALPGIGPWTANYIAMRALRWPDAFPKEDIVLRKRLGGVTAATAEALSQPWRPWRSYATLHLWHMPETSPVE